MFLLPLTKFPLVAVRNADSNNSLVVSLKPYFWVISSIVIAYLADMLMSFIIDVQHLNINALLKLNM